MLRGPFLNPFSSDSCEYHNDQQVVNAILAKKSVYCQESHTHANAIHLCAEAERWPDWVFVYFYKTMRQWICVVVLRFFEKRTFGSFASEIRFLRSYDCSAVQLLSCVACNTILSAYEYLFAFFESCVEVWKWVTTSKTVQFAANHSYRNTHYACTAWKTMRVNLFAAPFAMRFSNVDFLMLI